MRRIVCLVLVVFFVPAPVQAQSWSTILPGLEWFLREPPVSSEGSLHIRYWVNVWTGRDGVKRITDLDRRRMIKSGELVPLSSIPSLDIAKSLVPSKRYLQSWAASALAEVAALYRADTGRDLPLNSALRSVEQQTAILPRRVKVQGKWRWVGNMNAIPAKGPFGSAHPFGNTVDLARLRIPDAYESVFEEKLLRLESHRCLDLTRESGQAVFHVTFFKRCRVGTIAAVLEGM